MYPSKHLFGSVYISPGKTVLKTSNSVDVGRICSAGICGRDYCHAKPNML